MNQPRQKKNVEDVYRLSELQEALVLHHLERGPGEDAGSLMLTATLRGRLDRDLLELAFADVFRRHTVLRSSIHWKKLKHPVQVVAKRVQVPIGWQKAQDQEGRWLGGAALEEYLHQLALALQSDSLDLSRAPVSSLSCVQVESSEHRLFWACHHALLDGWSSALALSEVVERYNESASGGLSTRAVPRPYRDYVAWTRQRTDLENASWSAQEVLDGQGLWHQGLLEVEGRSSQPRQAVATGHNAYSEAEVRRWAQDLGVTASSLFAGCWALTLAEASGSSCPVFGWTVSGRAASFEGIDAMVGLFANTLPLALPFDASTGSRAWFGEVFERQQRLQTVEHRSIRGLFEQAGAILLRPPFDTLVAFANFPATAEASGDSTRPAEEPPDGQLVLADFAGDLTSVQPLTLAIQPGPSYGLEAHFDPQRLTTEEVEALLERFEALLTFTLSGTAGSVRSLLKDSEGDLESDARLRRPGPGSSATVSYRRRPIGGTGAEAPSTSTAAQLMRIWNDLIEVQEYGLDDNFFAVGGHSLLVAQLLVRIRQDFGTQLSLAAVMAAPTVRDMATVIDRARTESSFDRTPNEAVAEWPSLVPIRLSPEQELSQGGPLRPLFMVHGLGGEVGWFYNLANYLDPAIPLLGLQAPNEAYEDLVAMATQYLAELRAFSPSGPYRLGGYCIGGGVAYEMACQLEQAGETVEALVLIDSVPQAHAVGSGSADQSVVARLGARMKYLFSKEPGQIVDSIVDAARSAARNRLKRTGTTSGSPLELSDILDMNSLPQVYHEAARRHFRAMRDYEPGLFGGDVWLFRTEDPRFGEDFGWGPLVGGNLTICRVTGKHVDVLKEPHVKALGRRLSEVLAQRR